MRIQGHHRPLGGPVTIEFPVHNDGPQPARGIFVDYDSRGLTPAELDEVIHADRVLRPGTSGYIDVVEPGKRCDCANISSRRSRASTRTRRKSPLV